MVGHWISDGSPEIVTSDSSTVECVMADGSSSGNTFNAMWKDTDHGPTTGSHYWKITVSNLNPDSIFVGLTDTEKFKKGWGLKGLLFGGPGNLSNGSALVTGGYGPAIKSGSTAGILAIYEGGHLKVYFDLNGEPLGGAFDLPKTVLKGIFPCVHFNGTGTATVTKESQIPTDLVRKEPVFEGIEGDWKCVEFSAAKPLKSVTVNISKEEGHPGFRVGLHVINHIHLGLHQDPETLKWTGIGGISTRMGGSPEMMKFEVDMNNLFQNASKVEVDDGFLIVSSGDSRTSKWQRYSTAKRPVTENPFK